jgi:outer membrane biosynthesis protein TonB
MTDAAAAIRVLLLVALCGASLAGCASKAIQAVEDHPALVVPPVPPRAIEPAPVPETPPAEPVVEPPPTPTTTLKPTRTPRPATEKPEPKPAEVPPDTTAAAGPPNPPPVPPLRTATTPSGPEAQRQVRDILERAATILTKVDYQKLSDDRRANYNSAKNYMQQADEALKKDDLTLARSFADRAENIAKQLESGR